jgi:hypothetical protein
MTGLGRAGPAKQWLAALVDRRFLPGMEGRAT